MLAVPQLLYVDDTADTAASRAETLSSGYEFEAHPASGVATAQAALESHDIDCVISEFRLGDDDGLDLLSYVRSEHGSLPVILLIDDEPEEIARDAFNSGATDLFPRSMIELSYEPLVDRIRELTTEPAAVTEEMPSGADGGSANAGPTGSPSSTPTAAAATTGETASAETTETTTATDTPAGGTTTNDNAADTAAGAMAPEDTTTAATNGASDDLAVSDLDIDHLRALPKEELITLLAEIIGDSDEPATESAAAMAETIDPTGDTDTHGNTQPAPPETAGGSASTTSEPAMTDGAAATEEPTTEPDTAATPEPDTATATPESDPTDIEWEANDGYHRPSGLDLSPGTTVLVQCGSQDGRKHDAREDLLGVAEPSDRNILLIQYRSMNTDRLAAIAEAAQRVKVITVGCSQTVPNAVSDTVEVVTINNPNDVTRLGILSTKTLDDWQALDGGISVALDPLDVLFRYKSVEGTFRFLHIFLGKLSAGGAVSSFFVNPSASNPQDVNTLKPLFDHILTVDSAGVDLEGN